MKKPLSNEELFVQLLETTKKVLAGRLHIIIDNTYKQYCEKNNILILEGLNNCFFGNAKEESLLNTLNNSTSEEWFKEVCKLKPTNEQLLKIISVCFKNDSNLLVKRLPKKHIEILYDIISLAHYEKDGTQTIGTQRMIWLLDDINTKVQKNINLIDTNKLSNALQNLLKNNYKVLSENIDNNTQLINAQKIVESIQKMLPESLWDKFNPLIPGLPQRNIDMPIFIMNNRPILEMSIDNNAMLGHYKNLISHVDILKLVEKVVETICSLDLSGVEYIKKVSTQVEHNQGKNITLLIKSSTDNMPPIENIKKLLQNTFAYYHDNKIDIHNNTLEAKLFIQNEWLDICIPQNVTITKTTKKKI